MKKFLMIALALLAFAAQDVLAQSSEPPPIGGGDCGLEFYRTQTPGGWGAVPSGDNPGTYLHANFDAAFPEGLTIGCEDGNTLTFTSAQAITDFLPEGGTPAALTESAIDPMSGSANVLAGHVLALSLSIAFDGYDADFGANDCMLEDLTLAAEGPLSGQSVAFILDEANNVLGGCDSDFSASDLADALEMINENYVDGDMDNAMLN